LGIGGYGKDRWIKWSIVQKRSADVSEGVAMKRNTSIIIAFALAALLPAVVLAVATAIADKENPVLGLALVPLYFFFTAAATLFVGVPAFLVLNKFKLVRWWSATCVGCLIGGLMGFLMKQGVHNVAAMAVVGIASGLSFWFVWKQRS
jgi:hypothetical protein